MGCLYAVPPVRRARLIEKSASESCCWMMVPFDRCWDRFVKLILSLIYILWQNCKANTPQATFVKQGESRGRHIKIWMISFSLQKNQSLNIQVGNCEVSNPLYSFILPYRLLRLRGTLPNIIKSFAFNQIFAISNIFCSTWPWSLGSCCFPGWPYTGPKCSIIVINIFVIVMIHDQQKIIINTASW